MHYSKLFRSIAAFSMELYYAQIHTNTAWANETHKFEVPTIISLYLSLSYTKESYRWTILNTTLQRYRLRTHPFCRLRRAKEDGYERQPDDTGGVHGKSDGLGFVEGLGHASRLDGVNCARHHQQDGVTQGADKRQVRDVALEDPARRHRVLGALLAVVHYGVGRIHGKPHEDAQELN